MAVRFNPGDLKQIGMECKNRLPPASAVQAMFLYEMQRATEAQALFQGQLFELARVDDTSAAQETRIAALEDLIKQVHEKATAKELDNRLATSRVRTDALAARLNEHFVRLGEYGRRMTDVETSQSGTKEQTERESVKLSHKLDLANQSNTTFQTAIKASIQEENANFSRQLKSMGEDINTVQAATDEQSHRLDAVSENVNALYTTTKEHNDSEIARLVRVLDAASHDQEKLKANLDSADKEIGILFEERDALYGHLQKADESVRKSNERIDKLEDTVRALTLQKSPSGAAGPSRSPSVQSYPVATRGGGGNVELVVPKGKGFVSMGKEGVKPFIPGKSWGGA